MVPTIVSTTMVEKWSILESVSDDFIINIYIQYTGWKSELFEKMTSDNTYRYDFKLLSWIASVEVQ